MRLEIVFFFMYEHFCFAVWVKNVLLCRAIFVLDTLVGYVLKYAICVAPFKTNSSSPDAPPPPRYQQTMSPVEREAKLHLVKYEQVRCDAVEIVAVTLHEYSFYCTLPGIRYVYILRIYINKRIFQRYGSAFLLLPSSSCRETSSERGGSTNGVQGLSCC